MNTIIENELQETLLNLSRKKIVLKFYLYVQFLLSLAYYVLL